MALSPSGNIPVEAILKLSLDHGGQKSIEDFMVNHEKIVGSRRADDQPDRLGP
jgi:hypothetical protein